MKSLLVVTAVICSVLVATLANPVPEAKPDPDPKTDMELMRIPLDEDKELDVITLVSSDDQKINERNKRTIGILRELFPTISQILDQKIQMITSYLFRTLGPIILRSGLGGGGGGANAGGRDTTKDDFDDDFDDDDDDDSKKNISSDSGRKVSISLPTLPPSSDDDDDEKPTTASPIGTADENELSNVLRLTDSFPSAVDSSSSSSSSSISDQSSSDSATTSAAETVQPPTPGNSDNNAEQTPTTTAQNAQDSTDFNLV
ncbi:uncharacterized protein LOC129772960 isoform X2 [Toxorhynchites rutilus septentrionalis]|uniref:uncharacterized protein LOC129772960 isoform X2 n=1 Tax=Toxorhynchites rutilus septentrionalis TaxID=329112 RepID=UPI00247A5C5A|nr:uncharacterized protein LOC129772960 isoform X2 [Toxorhynchites rutilus septentrionalis]